MDASPVRQALRSVVLCEQALGCLLYFLMFGKLAFQAEAKLQILKGEVSLPPTRPPPLVALLRELLVVNPQHRPDIIAVLRRLQEVADALNIDPALLVPSIQPPAPGAVAFSPSSIHSVLAQRMNISSRCTGHRPCSIAVQACTSQPECVACSATWVWQKKRSMGTTDETSRGCKLDFHGPLSC